jgi:hypothetical protein
MIVSPRYQVIDAFRHISCAESTIEALSRATVVTPYSLLSAKTHLARRRNHVAGAKHFSWSPELCVTLSGMSKA